LSPYLHPMNSIVSGQRPAQSKAMYAYSLSGGANQNSSWHASFEPSRQEVKAPSRIQSSPLTTASSAARKASCSCSSLDNSVTQPTTIKVTESNKGPTLPPLEWATLMASSAFDSSIPASLNPPKQALNVGTVLNPSVFLDDSKRGTERVLLRGRS